MSLQSDKQAIAMIMTQQIKGHEPVTQVAILRTVAAQSMVGSYKHTLANAMLSQKVREKKSHPYTPYTVHLQHTMSHPVHLQHDACVLHACLTNLFT